MSSRPLLLNDSFILYIDDDPDDQLMVEIVMKSINPSLHIHGCRDGKEAFDFLQSIPEGSKLPNLIILDFNMPGWNGIRTLQEIRKTPTIKDIPVFIFTTSDYPEDKEASLKYGANAFLSKPISHTAMIEVCSVFAEYYEQPAQVK